MRKGSRETHCCCDSSLILGVSKHVPHTTHRDSTEDCHSIKLTKEKNGANLGASSLSAMMKDASTCDNNSSLPVPCSSGAKRLTPVFPVFGETSSRIESNELSRARWQRTWAGTARREIAGNNRDAARPSARSMIAQSALRSAVQRLAQRTATPSEHGPYRKPASLSPFTSAELHPSSYFILANHYSHLQHNWISSSN